MAAMRWRPVGETRRARCARLGAMEASRSGVMELRDALFESLRRKLEAEHPAYMGNLRAVLSDPAATVDAPTMAGRLTPVEASHRIEPLGPWEPALALLYDFEIKLDSIRWVNESVRAATDGRSMFHLTNMLSVAALAALEDIDDIRKRLERGGLIDAACSEAAAKRIAQLVDDEALQVARQQVAHSAAHVGEDAWVRAIAKEGYFRAAAVVSENAELPERLFNPVTMTAAEIARWQKRSAHVFEVLRTIGVDIVREMSRCVERS